MKKAHKSMTRKWTLPSGVVVEDKMVEFCIKPDKEHAGHSFILDTGDSCWKQVFDKYGLNRLKTFSVPTFVPRC
ncbi:hypothetical protein BDC45DRAFT_76407 [Circinella umbellata]|nr:hypothetical protein BDC45DRAFT_76039 [Circinella umbellata]KAI7855764.1 hypothetical protein BDC45DRAFT_76146 [Circinella umbellata]KAI7855768.1 hypothetical protein BDC45DRAFT_76407 [Circinella umbellata]